MARALPPSGRQRAKAIRSPRGDQSGSESTVIPAPSALVIVAGVPPALPTTWSTRAPSSPTDRPKASRRPSGDHETRLRKNEPGIRSTARGWPPKVPTSTPSSPEPASRRPSGDHEKRLTPSLERKTPGSLPSRRRPVTLPVMVAAMMPFAPGKVACADVTVVSAATRVASAATHQRAAASVLVGCPRSSACAPRCDPTGHSRRFRAIRQAGPASRRPRMRPRDR